MHQREGSVLLCSVCRACQYCHTQDIPRLDKDIAQDLRLCWVWCHEPILEVHTMAQWLLRSTVPACLTLWSKQLVGLHSQQILPTIRAGTFDLVALDWIQMQYIRGPLYISNYKPLLQLNVVLKEFLLLRLLILIYWVCTELHQKHLVLIRSLACSIRIHLWLGSSWRNRCCNILCIQVIAYSGNIMLRSTRLYHLHLQSRHFMCKFHFPSQLHMEAWPCHISHRTSRSFQNLGLIAPLRHLRRLSPYLFARNSIDSIPNRNPSSWSVLLRYNHPLDICCLLLFHWLGEIPRRN